MSAFPQLQRVLVNTWLLYALFATAMFYLFQLLMQQKFETVGVMALTGLVLSTFSKNMSVLLMFSMIAGFLYGGGRLGAGAIQGMQTVSPSVAMNRPLSTPAGTPPVPVAPTDYLEAAPSLGHPVESLSPMPLSDEGQQALLVQRVKRLTEQLEGMKARHPQPPK